MRNITGPPVQGDDFYPRPNDLARLCRELKNDGNVLLTAPRRVGKTSLVLEFCRLEREQQRPAVFLNVEGCHDELAFAEKLVNALGEAGIKPDVVGICALFFSRARQAVAGLKVQAGLVGFDLALPEDPDQGSLGQILERVFKRIEGEGSPVVVIIDEMPELLLALGRLEHGTDRVSRFLHWLRSLRQTYRQQVRWVFLGSIGLDSFVDSRCLRKTINDLTSLTMEALTEDEAHKFLDRLGRATGLAIDEVQRDRIARKIGWLLPHHLQIFVHALVDLGALKVDAEAVDTAFNQMLAPANLSQFDTWRQRLDEQLDQVEALAAKDILRHLCQHAKGRKRPQILDVLMSTRPSADAGDVEERLGRLLVLLQRDGYLMESRGQYSFRSFLLREYWHRREVS